MGRKFKAPKNRINFTGTLNYVNMPLLFVTLINNKVATYSDIKNNLTYQECLRLYDMCIINNYNNRIIQENQEK